MPVSYGSALNEHLVVRESVGLFDVSHMGEIEVTGPDSEAFLNYALSNDLRKCKVGQSQYSILCNEDGCTLDDLIIYRREEEKFLLCVKAAGANKLASHTINFKMCHRVTLEFQLFNFDYF